MQRLKIIAASTSRDCRRTFRDWPVDVRVHVVAEDATGEWALLTWSWQTQRE
jgi:hypothetical protein